MPASQLFHGVISGQRRRSHDEVADRSERIASGLQKLGVKQGDSVAMLMRNDIAFIEAAYAAMRLGAYGVPVNWHFKPEEINYVLKDCGTSVLIVVSVTLDTVTQIQAHLLAHQYEGLIKKARLRGKGR